MLHTLNTLAGKISPSATDNNANKVSHINQNNNNNNNLHHPYIKPAPASPPRNTNNNNDNNGINNNTSADNGRRSSSPDKKLSMDQPDPDYIKMFVGQLPHSLDEADLKRLFQEFGRVHQINVLRDKFTGQSKGCCFVTFYTRKAALDAQNALHNIKTFAGMRHPIQMKPADSENINERKLFVGMLSKKCSENDVRQMFSQFGAIEECAVLRDNRSQSKGCAFVTYTSKQCAVNAIKSMHHSQTMEGCSSPLVVKFADTQKEKDQKRLQQMHVNLLNLAGITNMGSQYIPPTDSPSVVSPSSLQLLQQIQANTAGSQNSTLSLSALQQQLLMQQQLQAAQGLQSFPGLGFSGTTHNPAAASDISQTNLQGLATLANLSVNLGVNPLSMQNLVSLAAMTGGSGANLQVSPSDFWDCSGSLTGACTLSVPAYTGLTNPSPGSLTGTSGCSSMSPVTGIGFQGSPLNGLGAMSNGSGIDAFTSAYPYTDMLLPGGGFSQFGSSGLTTATAGVGAVTGVPNVTGVAGVTGVTGVTGVIPPVKQKPCKQIEGPENSNLFIYHLPHEYTDDDLITMFKIYGNVISAKVFVDTETNLSKCFGFVSYDNPLSAQLAIKGMNGHQIGNKRLKVQLKKLKDSGKPY